MNHVKWKVKNANLYFSIVTKSEKVIDKLHYTENLTLEIDFIKLLNNKEFHQNEYRS